MLANKRLQVKRAMGENEPRICGEGRERAVGRGCLQSPGYAQGCLSALRPKVLQPHWGIHNMSPSEGRILVSE